MWQIRIVCPGISAPHTGGTEEQAQRNWPIRWLNHPFPPALCQVALAQNSCGNNRILRVQSPHEQLMGILALKKPLKQAVSKHPYLLFWFPYYCGGMENTVFFLDFIENNSEMNTSWQYCVYFKDCRLLGAIDTLSTISTVVLLLPMLWSWQQYIVPKNSMAVAGKWVPFRIPSEQFSCLKFW